MATTSLEIDHIFFFTPPEAVDEIEILARAGLVANNRRRHTGQGTANTCYVFDNAYLELLWVVDQSEITSASVARTRLAERSRWRETGASPFGIAVCPISGDVLPFETWRYEAPFLPSGFSLPVATASDDPTQPMLFQSPGTARPDEWKTDRGGERQKSAGLAEIIGVKLIFPSDIDPDPAFGQLASDGLISLDQHSTGPAMILTLSRRNGGPPRELSLPGCVLGS